MTLLRRSSQEPRLDGHELENARVDEGLDWTGEQVTYLERRSRTVVVTSQRLLSQPHSFCFFEIPLPSMLLQ